MTGALPPALELHLALEQGSFRLEVALEVPPGETLVLVGPSGSGKTTCLRAVAGLVRPREGRIVVGGRTVFDAAKRLDLPPWRRRLGVVFQDDALFPHLTVEQNLRYGLGGVPDAAARVRRWLRALDLEPLAKRRPAALSGGQRQRVALARAAATEADLLLLDEPFGALDPETRRSVRGELRRFLRLAREPEPGRTARAAVLVTHDYLDALLLGDRIAVLEAGRLTQVGPRDEVLRRPRTPFLAALTGHNVLAGELLPGGAGAGPRVVRVGEARFAVAAPSDLAPGAVYLSFGPEAVTLLREPGSLSARNRFPGVVRELLPLADRLRVHLRADAGFPLMADVVAEAAAELGLTEGARVTAAVKSTAIELYR